MNIALCLPLSAIVTAVAALATPRLAALEKTNITCQIFQFPADQIPRIDGDASDWAMVPEHYVVGPEGKSHRSKVWDVWLR